MSHQTETSSPFEAFWSHNVWFVGIYSKAVKPLVTAISHGRSWCSQAGWTTCQTACEACGKSSWDLSRLVMWEWRDELLVDRWPLNLFDVSPTTSHLLLGCWRFPKEEVLWHVRATWRPPYRCIFSKKALETSTSRSSQKKPKSHRNLQKTVDQATPSSSLENPWKPQKTTENTHRKPNKVARQRRANHAGRCYLRAFSAKWDGRETCLKSNQN